MRRVIRSADFRVCRIAGFPVGEAQKCKLSAPIFKALPSRCLARSQAQSLRYGRQECLRYLVRRPYLALAH